jgi:hypothetical protein
MEPVVLFEEIQQSRRMRHKWFYGIIAVLFGLALICNFIIGKDAKFFEGFLWGGFLVFILLQVFSGVGVVLITQIREDGIYVRFPPYQPSFKRFSWEEIAEIHIRKADPATAYGFGVRRGPNGCSYTLPGDSCVYILLKNGSAVTISTGKPEEVAAVLKRMGRIK